MRAYLEVTGPGLPELVALEGERTTLGRAEVNDVRLAHPTVSELHAVIESYGVWFALRDLGSSNGTFVNNEHLTGERRLRSGDEIILGEMRLTFRTEGVPTAVGTVESEAPPALTPREHDVLVALCRPMLDRVTFAQPTSIRQLAAELFVSEAAVKFHLANLYDKFGLHDTPGPRRVQLANEAIRRRAVTLTDLRQPPTD